MTQLSNFWDMLKKADWYYAYSDDHSVWQRGQNEEHRLATIAKESPEHLALYNEFRAGLQKRTTPDRPVDVTYNVTGASFGEFRAPAVEVVASSEAEAIRLAMAHCNTPGSILKAEVVK